MLGYRVSNKNSFILNSDPFSYSVIDNNTNFPEEKVNGIKISLACLILKEGFVSKE